MGFCENETVNFCYFEIYFWSWSSGYQFLEMSRLEGKVRALPFSSEKSFARDEYYATRCCFLCSASNSLKKYRNVKVLWNLSTHFWLLRIVRLLKLQNNEHFQPPDFLHVPLTRNLCVLARELNVLTWIWFFFHMISFCCRCSIPCLFFRAFEWQVKCKLSRISHCSLEFKNCLSSEMSFFQKNF